ncbi:hypothetical protein OIDMADRAFT_46807 [Oidiodendron maius Zn]|uniref:Zn(2)-C6 fungal-type domain-containing protein n=1 Tax=Oidiodendron maius (strain Zn) TaxID=913774 RepID=A0A0C3DXP2_OIDMZ|nr:hypothetical protein OIDMADRAFT_46807 [Oidiodendron maius Zn]
MSGDTPRIPKKPKLRSSCDGCGASKVKCDRVMPKCGRCVYHGMTCVYGVSQNIGKQPRQRLNPSSKRPSSDQASTSNMDELHGSSSRGVVLNVGSFPSVTNASATWDAVDDNINPLATHLDKLDDWYSDLPELSIPTFTSLDSGEEAVVNRYHNNPPPANLQFSSIPTPESPDLGSYLSIEVATAQPTVHKSEDSKNSHPDGASMPLGAIAGHDCSREACNILESLHSLGLSKDPSVSSSGTFVASATESTNRVPLDHVLRLNRIASERLCCLLTCSCAKAPHLALLYASIISRVLIWYERAACCTQSASESAVDIAWHHVYPAGSTPSVDSGPGSGSPAWSTTATSTFNTDGTSSTTMLRQYTGPAIIPTKMTVGTFNVDDLSVQTALKIQLVSGEMRRAGNLINQFALRTSSRQCLDNESASSGTDSLHKNLDTWLVGEHLRIANMMRSRLKELNTY